MSNPEHIQDLARRLTIELRFLDDDCPEEVVIDAVDLLARVIVAELRGREAGPGEFAAMIRSVCRALYRHPEIWRRL